MSDEDVENYSEDKGEDRDEHSDECERDWNSKDRVKSMISKILILEF